LVGWGGSISICIVAGPLHESDELTVPR
jgi:hypothetical protein